MKWVLSRSRAYLVVFFGHLLASTLVPQFALGDQVGLNSHSDDENRSDGHSNKGQLPSPNHSPKQASSEHGNDDDRLREDRGKQTPSVVTILDEYLNQLDRPV